MESVEVLQNAAQSLNRALAGLRFSEPVTHVYNPMEYAWDVYRQYLEYYGNGYKKVIFVGMNPGPFGMVQTGIPFGEITVVRDWLCLRGDVKQPAVVNPKRPVDGFSCSRSEVSGKRLWGLFAERFTTPEAFFTEHFVANYCPLAFFASGRNITPDKLLKTEAEPVLAACDAHLKTLVEVMRPEWVLGVGAWAQKRIELALGPQCPRKIGRILHPSPASPLANRGWASQAESELKALGVWP